MHWPLMSENLVKTQILWLSFHVSRTLISSFSYIPFYILFRLRKDSSLETSLLAVFDGWILGNRWRYLKGSHGLHGCVPRRWRHALSCSDQVFFSSSSFCFLCTGSLQIDLCILPPTTLDCMQTQPYSAMEQSYKSEKWSCNLAILTKLVLKIIYRFIKYQDF